MKRLISLAIFGFILISCAYEASAQSISARSLKGIKRIEILVEDLDSDGRRFITKDEIARIVSERLRKRGIVVIGNTGADDRYNYLYVNLNLISDERAAYSNVLLEFNQSATLDNNDRMSVATWKKSILGKTGLSGARNQIIAVIEELTDQFLLDYLTVNR